jgi:putative MFS transporter
MVIASEEFPADRRGAVIGVVAAFSSLGAITCAALVPFLLRSPYGWRTVYFVAILPLLTLAYARRGLKETRRFEEQGPAPAGRSVFHVWSTPHRKRVMQLGAIWFLSYIATQNTVTFWKDFAVTERGLSDGEVGGAIALAAVIAMPAVFLVGKAMDRIGRRPAAALVLSASALGTWGCYTLEGWGVLTAALVLGIFASSAHLPVLSAITTELFPTAMRADGFAWSNNLVGRAGYVLSPAILGYLASSLGWGPVIRATAIFPLVCIALIYRLLPETRGRPLEETAAL